MSAPTRNSKRVLGAILSISGIVGFASFVVAVDLAPGPAFDGFFWGAWPYIAKVARGILIWQGFTAGIAATAVATRAAT